MGGIGVGNLGPDSMGTASTVSVVNFRGFRLSWHLHTLAGLNPGCALARGIRYQGPLFVHRLNRQLRGSRSTLCQSIPSQTESSRIHYSSRVIL